MLHANGSSSFKCFWRILIDLYSNDSEMSSCTRIDEVEESEHWWAHSRHLSCGPGQPIEGSKIAYPGASAYVVIIRKIKEGPYCNCMSPGSESDLKGFVVHWSGL